jgi:hypothetical protein
VQPVLLSLSFILYFFFFYVMNLRFYQSEFLFGTFAPAMGDFKTYLGLLFTLVFMYTCEKLVPLAQGKYAELDFEFGEKQKHSKGE